jgi:hypothetical protein
MSENSKPTQNDRVVQYMKDFGSITQMDAIRDLGVMRLASRISDLKRNGVAIESSYEKVKNRYGEETQIKRYALAANQ